MSDDLFNPLGIDAAVAALEKDLTASEGPSISTMRNHNFAILVYAPAKEFLIRQRIRQMTGRLESEGWSVLSIALHQLVLERVRALGADEVKNLITREKRLYTKGLERAQADLKSVLAESINGENGLAADVAQRISDFSKKHPGNEDRTLVLLGRAGALYPYFRSSALLKRLGGRTKNLPVVLLYPGERRDGGLSFMQELEPDRDYRPRIYG